MACPIHIGDMNGQRISVLHFSNMLTRGGAEEHILTLLRGMDRNRFRLSLVCCPEVALKLRADIPSDVALLQLRLRKPSQAGAAIRLARFIRSQQTDVLHSHLFYGSLFASPIGRMCRVPVIVETSHVREQWRRGWLKSRFFVDRLVGRCVDYYIAVSEANARYLVQEKELPARKIRVIHNGCDIGRFDPARPAPAGMRQALGIGEHNPVLLVLGRLEPQKGHRVLLKALSSVRREFPLVRLLCVGEGSLRAELERQMASLHLQDAIRFVGYQRNVPDWLALADFTVLPSFYEGLPLVAIESLAAGRPVVASSVDGTPEVVLNEKTGLTVPPGDANQLTNAILRLLRNPQLRRNLGLAGREWVLERFSQARQIEQTQESYLSAYEERVCRKRNVHVDSLGDEVRAGEATVLAGEDLLAPKIR